MPSKFYQKASVQVAIITSVALLIATLLTIMHQRSDLSQENKRLSRLTLEQANEIQRLETQLTPFRTIALQEFAGPEAEALEKLAQRITTIDRNLAETIKELDSTKQHLDYIQKDRILDDSQINIFKNQLKDVTGKVVVKADIMDPEALALSEQIKTAILKTKLSIVKDDFIDIAMLYEKGAILLVNNIKHTPPHALPVQKALLSIGIKAPGATLDSQNIPNDVIVIYICHK